VWVCCVAYVLCVLCAVGCVVCSVFVCCVLCVRECVCVTARTATVDCASKYMAAHCFFLLFFDEIKKVHPST